ncbi:hypothetical protein [Leptospira idonii]|uniref:Uncharacterized protein n=1 Tax=Leptospira idonii TaxID=1193500 RepID=A0A4R9M7H4_9LEPT|nr:hypothetical protein [Leptospira idonii]TGN20568.1 hypothetical protein EHS15_02960 [Leptospira idonii]
MALQEYLKIQWKKPSLSSEETEKEDRKKQIEVLLENAYSRLESLEILNSNGKWEDSSILSRYLGLDLINLLLQYSHKPKLNFGDDWKAALSSSNLETKFSGSENLSEVLDLLRENKTYSEKESEKIENGLGDFLAYLEKHFRILRRSELFTPIELFKKRIFIQGMFLVSLVLIAVGSVIYNKVRYPEMSQTDVQVFYLETENTPPSDPASTKLPLLLAKKGEWNIYEFVLPKKQALSGVRIDPLEQKRMKFSVDSLKVFDADGKILYERGFLIGPDLLPEGKGNFGQINDVKVTNKALPGNLIEMETTGNDPYFTVFFPQVKDAAKVELKMRHLEAHKKFQNEPTP